MTFNLTEFNKNLKPFVRKTNFKVLVNGDEKLAFFINSIIIGNEHVELNILEDENLSVLDTIREWSSSKNVEIIVELYNISGECTQKMLGVCDKSKEISYHSELNWVEINKLMEWKVKIPVVLIREVK